MRRLIFVSVLLSLASACQDECSNVGPSFQVDISLENTPNVRSLVVDLTIDGERRQRTFDVSMVVADGETSFSVDVGPRLAAFNVGIEVVAMDAANGMGLELARVADSFSATPDGCNQFRLALGEPRPGGCGDGTLQDNEVCDGPLHGANVCPTFGLRAGTGGLECNMNCSGFIEPESSCVGGPIDSEAQIRGALEDVSGLGRRVRVAIRPGQYSLSIPLTIDTCSGPCTEAAPGIELAPFDGGDVTFTGPASPLLRVVSGNNDINRFSFADAPVLVELTADAFAGGNVISECEFTDFTDLGILIASDDNRVSTARFVAASAGATSALRVAAVVDTRLLLGVIEGTYAVALDVTAGAQGETQIDHLSVALMGAGTAIKLVAQNPSHNFCLRNALIVGAGASVGLDVAQMARLRDCGGVESSKNAVVGHGTRCVGRCNDCDADVCDLGDAVPVFGDALCLPDVSPYVDAGLELGLDLNADGPGLYEGLAPEVGARERGSTLRFGVNVSTCP